MPGDRLFVARERPHTYGAFRVQPELGAAPSDSAYLALDPSTNATVVVQTLDVRGNRQRKDGAILNALRSLSAADAPHRSIALPIASGLEGRMPYVVYPHPAGITLRALVHDRGARPLAEVVECLLPVASAIDAAAAAGMHHGALTPSDIFVSDDGAVTVTRFGLVDALKHVELDAPVESAFASQDRAGGAAPALADDVYSLAAIALYMMAGRTRDMTAPRDEERFRDVGPEWTSALTRAEEQTIKTAAGADSRLLQPAISRALSEDPSARQPRAIDLVNELRHAIVEARPRSKPVNDTLQGFESEPPDPHAPPKVARMIRPTAPPVVPRPPAVPPPSAAPMPPVTAPLPTPAAPPPPLLAREPMRRPATFMSDAVPVVHTGRGKRNIALVLLVVGIVGAAFASGLLVRTPDDLIPSFPARRTSTPIDETPPAPREPFTSVVPTDPGPAAPSQSPVAKPPSSEVPNEADSQPATVPPPLEPTPSETTIGQGDSIAARPERRTARPAPAPPPATAVNPNTPGSLFATSRPTHAQLFVDDLLVGTMPLLMSGVSPGTHRVRVELPGWNTWSSSVQIEPGKRFTLDVRLDR